MIWHRLSQAWREHAEARALARRPVRPDLWKRTLRRYPFLRRRDDLSGAQLLRLTRLFLDSKQFHAVGAIELRDDVVVAIAAQACLPVLKLGLERYQDFVGIVVHEAQVVAPRSVVDESGVVHEYEETLSGEAVQGGPVMLSWQDVRRAGQTAGEGYNVVIHEFAHVLDMADGLADGQPRLPPGLSALAWSEAFERRYQAFCADVDAGRPGLLDPYAASAPPEFFAVLSESFFVDPLPLRDTWPDLYDLLSRYYRQDPAVEGLFEVPRTG